MSDKVVVQSKVTRIQMRGNAKVFTLDRETIALIDKHRPKVVVRGNAQLNVIDKRPRVTIGGGLLQGPPGETEGATFLATCGMTIHGERMVRIANDQIFEPDTSVNSDALGVIGLALQAGTIGNQVLVRSAGSHTEPSWNWAPGQIYCADGGQLTQSPDPTRWLLAVGVARDATTIEINIEQPIMRSP